MLSNFIGLLKKYKNNDGVFDPNILSHISTYEQRDIERLFARLFQTEDGKKVIAYLQYSTFHRALGPDIASDHLRYLEGQRAMVSTITRLIQNGRKN